MYIDFFFSPECAGNYNFYEKWIIFAFIPLIIIAAFAVAVFIDEDRRKGMVNLAMSVMYVYCLNQCWKMWDCVELGDGDVTMYVVESDPSIECFTADVEWAVFATLAFSLLLLFLAFPCFLYVQLKSKTDDESSRRRLGYLYLKYKDEYWWWDPVVEMSKKWMFVFWSIFMPTGYSQVAMQMIIVIIYWYVHAKNLPYRTNWKDIRGNLLPEKMQNLENNLQHWMYCAEFLILLGMLSFFHDEVATDARDAGTIILFIIYFGAMMWIGINIIRVWLRQRVQDERSSRYGAVVVEAPVAEMVEYIEESEAFGADHSSDIPKNVDSCGEQREEEGNTVNQNIFEQTIMK